MEWQFLAGLGAITSVVIALVIFLGLRLNKAVLKRAPEIALPIYINRSGTVLFALIVSFWLVCLVAAKLRPETSLGAFLGTADGVGVVVVGSLFFAGVAGAVLEKLGWPIASRGEDS